jgi:hypothetical protein
MTASELIRHTFPWELAPGIPAAADGTDRHQAGPPAETERHDAAA